MECVRCGAIVPPGPAPCPLCGTPLTGQQGWPPPGEMLWPPPAQAGAADDTVIADRTWPSGSQYPVQGAFSSPTLGSTIPPGPPPPRRRSAVPVVVGLIVAALVVGSVTVGLLLRSRDAVAGTPGGGSVPVPGTRTTPRQTVAAERETAAGCSLRGAVVEASGTATPGVDDSGAPISYDASNLIDGDPATAWRVPGRGIGESITVSFPRACSLTSLDVLNGYLKSDPVTGVDRWAQNRRVSQVAWRAGDESGTRTLDFQSRSTQTLTIGPVEVTSVTLTIVGSAPDVTERDFVALSEVLVSQR